MLMLSGKLCEGEGCNLERRVRMLAAGSFCVAVTTYYFFGVWLLTQIGKSHPIDLVAATFEAQDGSFKGAPAKIAGTLAGLLKDAGASSGTIVMLGCCRSAACSNVVIDSFVTIGRSPDTISALVIPTAEEEAIAASHAELIPSSSIWCMTRTPRWPAKISTSALDVTITVSRTIGASRSAMMIRRARVKYME